MPAAVLVNGNGNGHVPNRHPLPDIKASAAKSRGALKRLKAKAKAKGGRGPSESASEAGTESERESDVEVSVRLRYDSPATVRSFMLDCGWPWIPADPRCQSIASTASTATTSIDTSSFIPDASDPAFSAFASVFAHFQGDGTENGVVEAGPAKGEVYYSDEEDEDEEDRERAARKAFEQQGMTRRQKRQAAVGVSTLSCQ